MKLQSYLEQSSVPRAPQPLGTVPPEIPSEHVSAAAVAALPEDGQKDVAGKDSLVGGGLALIPALQWAIKVQPLKLSSKHHAPMASRVVPAVARAVGFWEALENRVNQQRG